MMKVKVKKMSNQPTIFSLNTAPADEGDVKEECPCCRLAFAEHTTSQLIKCALAELGGN